MSTIKVEVTTINDVRQHSNADSLELATVGGWQMCVRKDQYKTGDAVVYFEQGTVLPRSVADEMGVTNYLSEKLDIDDNRVLVVHRIKLRGEPSFGLVVKPEEGMSIGDDVAAHYGATKFCPPVKTTAGDAESPHPMFPVYTDIENMRSYPCVICDGEEVVATEKLHGTSARLAFVGGKQGIEIMAGSKTLRRKMPVPGAWEQNTYWYPWTLDSVSSLMADLYAIGHQQSVLFGEVFGKGIQSYTYDQKSIAFRAFDLMVDGQYLSHDKFAYWCNKHGVEMVPLIYRGAYSLDVIKRLSDGPSIVGGTHGREGVVVRPTTERQDSKIGRVILKYVGDQYLFGKAAEQDTTDQ